MAGPPLVSQGHLTTVTWGATLWLSLAYYHFVLPHDSLRSLLPEFQPTRGTGSPKKWALVTPAMAAGLTDHVWTMEELLSDRVPPDFRNRLDQQSPNVTA